MLKSIFTMLEELSLIDRQTTAICQSTEDTEIILNKLELLSNE